MSAPRVGRLRRALQCVAFYALLFHLGAMSLTWSLASALLWPFVSRARGARIGRAAVAAIYRSFWTCAQAAGLMRIDDAELRALDREGGLIIAANHPTMFDALIIIARVPRGVCIMRASLMRNPFLGAGARLARYIRNDPVRGMIRAAVADLRDGGQLVLFPEGTRTVREPVNPLRPGITLIAQRAAVPIQTVLIHSESGYLRKGWPIWRLPAEFPVVISARLGQRFAPQADHHGQLARLEAYFAAALAPHADGRAPAAPFSDALRGASATAPGRACETRLDPVLPAANDPGPLAPMAPAAAPRPTPHGRGAAL